MYSLVMDNQENKPDLRVLEGGSLKPDETASKKTSMVESFRKKLSGFLDKIDTNKENITPSNKGF